MKKLLVIKTIIIALCLGVMTNSAKAQLDGDPALTSMSFAASPIFTNVNPASSHFTTLTVVFVNAGFVQSIPANTVRLNISLPLQGYYKASPEGIVTGGTPQPSGSFANKFTWTWNAALKTFSGTNNQAIAPLTGGQINILVVGIQDIILATSNANLLILNPGAIPNENSTNNSVSAGAGVATRLPIKLLDFTATKQTKSVLLNWRTSQEINSKNFDVQFSKNGIDWTSIGIVNAAGFSNTTKSYSFVHTAPVNGINYYRLKQVDIDAFFEYSPTRIVNFNTKATIAIFPNPTTDKVYISTNGGGSFKSVTLYSIDGKIVRNIDNFLIGSSIDLSSYAPATYMLKVTDKLNVSEYIKVVKK